jgi:DNA-binding beta-propeller fold protein YncE
VTATLDMGGKPEFAVADGKGRVYVNNEDTAEIWAIDARTRTVAARWSVKPLHEPSGLAMDVAHGRLFSVAGNKLMAVLDVATGKVLKTLPIGAGCDGVAFDPGTGCAYAANGEGTVTVVKEGADGQYQVIATVPSHRRARTLAVDEKTHKLYLPAADDAPLPVDAKPGQRPGLLPGSFQVLVMGPAN